MEKEDLNLNELVENIRRIKGAIKQNSYTFQQLIYRPMMKFILFIGGLTSLFVPFFYYCLMKRYITYEAIPFEIRLSLIISVIIGLAVISLGKLILYRQARHITPDNSWGKTFIRLISRQALFIYPVLLSSIIFLAVFFMMRQDYHLIVPTLAVGMGICFSVIGSFISLPEFFIFGSYLWILGTLSVPFIVKAPLTSLLWVSGIFGLGMLVFAFYLTFFYPSEKER